jgi:hypothetical protein
MTARSFVVAAAALAVSACALSPKSLAELPPKVTIASRGSAQAVATCVAESLIGWTELRGSGSHYWAVRFSFPMNRWDFVDQPGGGSVAVLRGQNALSDAQDKVRACAEGVAA